MSDHVKKVRPTFSDGVWLTGLMEFYFLLYNLDNYNVNENNQIFSIY